MSESWVADQWQCLGCGHEWVAVRPLGSAPLECSACGGCDTAPEEDDIDAPDLTKRERFRVVH